MRALLLLTIILFTSQANALSLGHYHQGDRKIFSNVPAKCIKNNILVCPPGSIINNNENTNIQNKDLGTIKEKKEKMAIKVSEPKTKAKTQSLIVEKIQKKEKSVAKKKITKAKLVKMVKKVVKPKAPIAISTPIKVKKVITKPDPIIKSQKVNNDLKEPTLVTLSTTYQAAETYIKKASKEFDEVIYLGCEQAYYIDDLGWETKCKWRNTNSSGISRDYTKRFIIVDNTVTLAD